MLIETTVAGVRLAKMASDMKKSDELNERAKKKRKQAFNTISEAETERMHEEEKMNQAVLRLTTRKKGILITSIKSFIDVYGKIKKINFRESDGIKELDKFSPACCSEMQKQFGIIQQKSPESRPITKNMIKGFLVADLWGAVTASIVDDAENELNMAKDKARQAQVIAEQKKIYSLSYKSVSERANRMTEILTALNLLFVKSISNTDKIIEEKGLDRNNYVQSEIGQIGTCLNLAKAVKDILDAPILDTEGELSQEALNAIQQGNQCVIDMNDNLANI